MLNGLSEATGGRLYKVPDVQELSEIAERISLQLREISIKNLLNEVEKQTPYRFVYHTGTLPEDKKVTINVTNAGLDEVLSKVFAGLSLTYTVKEDNLVVIFSKSPRPPADKSSAH